MNGAKKIIYFSWIIFHKFWFRDLYPVQVFLPVEVYLYFYWTFPYAPFCRPRDILTQFYFLAWNYFLQSIPQPCIGWVSLRWLSSLWLYWALERLFILTNWFLWVISWVFFMVRMMALFLLLEIISWTYFQIQLGYLMRVLPYRIQQDGLKVPIKDMEKEESGGSTRIPGNQLAHGDWYVQLVSER